MRKTFFTLFILILIISFSFSKTRSDVQLLEQRVETPDTMNTQLAWVNANPATESPVKEEVSPRESVVFESMVDPGQFVNYAKTLEGIPYVYGSTDPAVGFDCSGFINHVASHFGLKVPRSSVQFTNVGTEIQQDQAKEGDLILFTGTDPSTGIVGHMGIVTENKGGELQFIHSSSGKAKGVVISPLEGYYETRFVKVIRIFDEEGNSKA